MELMRRYVSPDWYHTKCGMLSEHRDVCVYHVNMIYVHTWASLFFNEGWMFLMQLQ